MIKISIVEDVKEMRDTLIKVISDDPNLSIISVHETVEDAQLQIPVHKPEIVLLDLRLHWKSGIDVLKKVKESNPSIQFLVCTIYQDDENVFNSLKAGASGYILKKAGGEEIRNCIKELYNGGSPMSPEIARMVVNSFATNDKKLEDLSPREIEILDCISLVPTYKDAAVRLDLSPSTIRTHLHNIYAKLHVNNKTDAVNRYLRR